MLINKKGMQKIHACVTFSGISRGSRKFLEKGDTPTSKLKDCVVLCTAVDMSTINKASHVTVPCVL